MVECQAFWNRLRPDPRVHLPKRSRQPLEVPEIAFGGDVDVSSDELGSMDDGGETTDEDVTDLVLVENAEDAPGVEVRFAWQLDPPPSDPP